MGCLGRESRWSHWLSGGNVGDTEATRRPARSFGSVSSAKDRRREVFRRLTVYGASASGTSWWVSITQLVEYPSDKGTVAGSKPAASKTQKTDAAVLCEGLMPVKVSNTGVLGQSGASKAAKPRMFGRMDFVGADAVPNG